LIKIEPTIALFGGSFDPPHIGHQTIIKKVSSLSDIDTLIVMPAFLNPFKKATLATAQKRLEWCREICTSPKVMVSDFEISQGRSVYTIETLEYLSDNYCVKYLVIGSDNLKDIQKWRDFEKIDASIIWLVASREGSKPDYSQLREYRVIEVDMPISSTAIRQGDIADSVDKRIEADVNRVIQNRQKGENR
jgi:nicotinate-nucleotide adenylyltransferase